MLITLRFKTPDVIDDALDRADFEAEAKKEYEKLDLDYRITLDGEAWLEEKADELRAAAREQIAKIVNYGEYITVWYDTDTNRFYIKQ